MAEVVLDVFMWSGAVMNTARLFQMAAGHQDEGAMFMAVNLLNDLQPEDRSSVPSGYGEALDAYNAAMDKVANKEREEDTLSFLELLPAFEELERRFDELRQVEVNERRAQR